MTGAKATRRAALPTTIVAVSALLKADTAIDEGTVADIVELLNGGPAKPPTPTMEARPLVKRGELMRLTGLCGVSIDRFARAGFLQRVYLGNGSRASGFTPESVEKFLAGRPYSSEAVKGGVA